MKGHRDDWIENRIIRSLGKRGLPNGQTVFGRDSWDKLPPGLRAVADAGAVGRPVVSFVGGEQLWTLLGTDAVYCRRDDRTIDLSLDDLGDVSLIGNTLPKPCEEMELIDLNGKRHLIWGPPGEGCLALCGTLLTLLRLRKE
jgi:hypothetical protein